MEENEVQTNETVETSASASTERTNVGQQFDQIQDDINTIKDECDEIKVVKPFSEESKIIGNRTFLVEKNKKRIICHNVERKLLYCIAKIGKKEKIISDSYFITFISSLAARRARRQSVSSENLVK